MRTALAALTVALSLLAAPALAQRKNLPPTHGGLPPDKMPCAQKCIAQADDCTKKCKNQTTCTSKCAEALGQCVDRCGIQAPPPPPEGQQ